MTEGQFAEQQAAREGGFFEEGIHGQTLVATYCFNCLLAGVGDRHASGPRWVLDNRSEVEFE